MDAKRTELEAKLEDCLKQASAVAAQLQGLEQDGSTPHFDQIELPAHELGQRLSPIPFNEALGAGLLTLPQTRPQVSLNPSKPLILETFGRAMCGVGRPAHSASVR